MPNPIRMFQSVKSKKKKRMAVTVTVTVENNSSDLVEWAEFFLSDDSTPGDEDPIVKTIKLTNIEPGEEKSGSKSFPTGIEKVVYKFKVEDDDEIYDDFGLGNNAEDISLTIED